MPTKIDCLNLRQACAAIIETAWGVHLAKGRDGTPQEIADAMSEAVACLVEAMNRYGGGFLETLTAMNNAGIEHDQVYDDLKGDER